MNHDYTPTPPDLEDDDLLTVAPMTMDDLERLAGAGASAAGVTPRSKKGRKHARKDTRFRCQFRFHLDANKPEEYAIGQELTALKSKRRYLPTIRDALRLFLSLMRGETDVLKALFPLIVDQIELEMIRRDDDDISGQLADLRRAIDEQGKKIIPLFDNNGGMVMAGQKPTLGGLQKMSAPLIDDDEDTVVINKTAAPNVMQNFLDSFAKLGD